MLYDKLMEEITIYAKELGEENAVRTYEDLILQLKVPRLSLWFCMTFKSANVMEHQKLVYGQGTADQIYHFAAHVNGADRTKAKLLLLEKGDARLLILFARLPGEDVSDIDDFILSLKEPSISALFLSELERFGKKAPNSSKHKELIKMSTSKESAHTYLLNKKEK